MIVAHSPTFATVTEPLRCCSVAGTAPPHSTFVPARHPSMMSTAEQLSVGVVCDFVEEGWPSMDLVAAMLLRSLAENHAHDIRATAVRPAMATRFRALPVVGALPAARNADR